MIIALDMGGTNIDAVILKDNKVIKVIKEPVDFNNMFNSIWDVISSLLENVNKDDISKVNLSTTISTNAIIENKTNKVGLIIQTGPGLIINNNDAYKISGYTDHRGVVVSNFNDNEVIKIKDIFIKDNIKDIAIVTKFSTRNNETELKIKSMLENNFDNITLGHLMSGNLNFPRRINTAYLNASVKDIFISFAENTIKSFKQLNIDIPINILKADGGVMDISDAKDLPVQTIMSGPAASLMGTLGLTNINTDAIILDIGGTTTDIFFLADGIPLFEPTGINIKEYKTLVRSIYSKSIGLGGDSLVKVVNNKIEIGPVRLDKAAALGGKYPTPTDALIILNQTNLGNIDLSNKAISKLANEINLSIKETAKLIVDTFIKTIKDEVDILLKIINSKPVYTIKEIIENKELVPKSIAVIGASANAFSSFLEKSFNLEVLIPKNYEVANAIGSALAITTKEINLLINTFLKTYVVPELGINKKINKNYNLKEAEEEALKLLDEHLTLRSNDSNLELEVLESNSFSMVDGFYTKGENIRVKVQVKPGLTRKM